MKIISRILTVAVFSVALMYCSDSGPTSSINDRDVKGSFADPNSITAATAETEAEVIPIVTIIEDDAPPAKCVDLGYDFGFRVGDPSNGTYSVALENVENENGGPLVITISNYSNDYTGNGIAGFDWSSNIPVGAVKVKAGTPSTLYTYEPATKSGEGVLSDRSSVSHINFCYNAFVEVEKTAYPSFDREWEWSIAKANDSGSSAENRWNLNALSEDFDVDYTITVGAEVAEYRNFAVSGTITVTNPAIWGIDAEIAEVKDIIDGVELDVDCGVNFPETLSPGEELVCSYSGTFDEMPGETLVNTAIVEVTEASGVKGGSATADVAFDLDDPDQVNSDINECISVDDPLLGIEGYEVCLDDLNSYGEYEITESYDVRDFEDLACGEFDVLNTAQFGDLEGQIATSTVFVDFECVLDANKTAVTSFDRDWEWDIDKDNDSGSAMANPLLLTPGQSFEVEYTVSGGAMAVDHNFAVNGVITIANSAVNPEAARITEVSDKIGDVVATVDCGMVTFPYDLEPGHDFSCSYSADLPNSDSATNTAKVKVDSNYSDFSDATATADVIFDLNDPDNVTNNCIDISDSLVPSVDDTICVGDLVNGNYNITYSINLNDYIFSPADCGAGELENIASFITNDDMVTDSDNSIVYFDLTCEAGCTLSQGYWRTHSIYGPAPYDDNWANIPGGAEDAPFFLSGQTYYEVMWTPPRGNSYYQLAPQWVAAYLNVLNGADIPADVESAWNDAKELFETYTPEQVANLRGQAARPWRDLASILDDYNNGLLGPGKCSEDGNGGH